jgi:hypothetical protein
VDAAQTQAQERLTELRVLLDLQTDRLWELAKDFAYLQEEMVRCHAMLATLPTGSEPSGEEPSPADIWGDQTSA